MRGIASTWLSPGGTQYETRAEIALQSRRILSRLHTATGGLADTESVGEIVPSRRGDRKKIGMGTGRVVRDALESGSLQRKIASIRCYSFGCSERGSRREAIAHMLYHRAAEDFERAQRSRQQR